MIQRVAIFFIFEIQFSFNFIKSYLSIFYCALNLIILLRHYLAQLHFIFAFETNTSFMKDLQLQHYEMNLFEGGGSYINCKRIYFSYYKKIPNIKVIKNINETLFNKWLDSNFGSEILKTHSSQTYSAKKKGMRSVNTIYFLTNELMIDIEDGYVVLAHQEEQEAAAVQIIQLLKKL